MRIRLATVEDVPQLFACFTRCYGDTYPDSDFQDATRIASRLADGSLRSMIAISEDGDIVGHMALTIRYPDTLTVEAGNTIVDPAFRGQRLALRIGIALSHHCRDEGYIGYHHYPTTAHPIMQTLAVSGSGAEMGLMLDYIPSTIKFTAIDTGSDRRFANTIVYQPLAPAPHREVYVPTRYASLVERLYAEVDIPRTLTAPASGRPEQVTSATVEENALCRYVAIKVHAIGHDLARCIDRHLGEHRAEVIHVDLPMNDPHIAHAVDTLCGMGWYFCGVFPEFHTGDVLRLQRIEHPTPTTFAPTLATPGGKRLLDDIIRDRNGERIAPGLAHS